MATVKLTKAMRDAIAEKVMRDAYAKERAELAKEVEAFSLRIYDHIVPLDVQSTANLLPNGFTYSGQTMTAYFYKSEDDVSTYKFRLTFELNFGKSLRLPYSFVYSPVIVSASLYSEAEALRDKVKIIADLKANLNSSIIQTLLSVPTIAALLLIWPEAEQFINPAWLEEKKKLPMVLPADLKAKLAAALPEIAAAA